MGRYLYNDDNDDSGLPTGKKDPFFIYKISVLVAAVVMFAIFYGDYVDKKRAEIEAEQQSRVLTEDEKEALCDKKYINSMFIKDECHMIITRTVHNKQDLEEMLGNNCIVKDIVPVKDRKAMATADCNNLKMNIVLRSFKGNEGR